MFFSVVIPLIPQHDRNILKLFRTLASSNSLIGEVIVARSETQFGGKIAKIRFNIYKKISNLDAKLIFDFVPYIARDGENRSRAWKHASCRYVMFLDADDDYARERPSVLLRFAADFNPDVILHSYSDVNISEIAATLPLEEHQALESRKLLLSREKTSITGLGEVIEESSHSPKIHFAHVTVKNDIKNFLNFTDRFPGADMEFTQNAIRQNFAVLYLPLELSSWGRKRTLRYKYRLIKHKILFK